jgi:hypothetical protein
MRPWAAVNLLELNRLTLPIAIVSLSVAADGTIATAIGQPGFGRLEGTR